MAFLRLHPRLQESLSLLRSLHRGSFRRTFSFHHVLLGGIISFIDFPPGRHSLSMYFPPGRDSPFIDFLPSGHFRFRYFLWIALCPSSIFLPSEILLHRFSFRRRLTLNFLPNSISPASIFLPTDISLHRLSFPRTFALQLFSLGHIRFIDFLSNKHEQEITLNFFIFKDGPLNFFIFKKGNHKTLISR